MIKRLTVLMLGLLCLGAVPALAVTIGPAQTKLEREQKSREHSVSATTRYETVVAAFLAENFAEAESQADHYTKKHAREKDADEIRYLRALSLMKLGRFDEARVLLRTLESEASTQKIRQQAAYSLGDSFYFTNQRKEADLHYLEALRKYPQAGEAHTVRRLMGPGFWKQTSTAQQFGVEVLETRPLPHYVQVGVFARERNAERLLNKLLRNNFEALIEKNERTGRYHVRVRSESDLGGAKSLEARLKKAGYPTKIIS